MNIRLVVSVCLASLLSACAVGGNGLSEETMKELLQEGNSAVKTIHKGLSGAVVDGKKNLQDVKVEEQDVEQRAMQIGSGVLKIFEAEKLIQQGVKGK